MDDLVHRLSQSHKSERCSHFAVSDSLRQLRYNKVTRSLTTLFYALTKARLGTFKMFDGIIIKNNRTE